MSLPVIVLKGLILLPKNEIRLEFDDEKSKSLVDISTIFHDSKILVVNYFDSKEKVINLAILSKVVIFSNIKNKIVLPNGKTRVTIEGIKRQIVDEFFYVDDIIEANILKEECRRLNDDIIAATKRKLKYEIESCVNSVPSISNGILSMLSNIDDLSEIIDMTITYLPIDKIRLCKYASTFDVIKRSEMLLNDLYREKNIFEIEKELENKVKKELDINQKDYILKEKLKIIKQELGDLSLREEEVKLLNLQNKKLEANDNIKNRINREIERYSNIPDISPEISVVRNYIDWMLSLPWNKVTKDLTDLNLISERLNKTHFGLDEAKLRIIEYLAVKNNSPHLKSPIICLVGPPGVGKTTLASSIASCINRKFIKISVAGVNDESEIIGHRKSYVGASPGKIIMGLRRAKTSNPVILIDEIDKMTKSYEGDPASALLEVLDSNQNHHFVDNYIEEAVDLSQAIFILTANNMDNIPLALRDRLEIVQIDGYSELEKLDIAKKYLVPNILFSHGLSDFKIMDSVIINIIRNYTKEAGVRELERSLATIVRKVVTQIVKDKKKLCDIFIDNNNINKYLGKCKYIKKRQNENQIGVVNGLSCTQSGGEVMSIEVNYYKGKGNLILTGCLGDIIKESAMISLSYIKANYKKFNIRYEDLINNDIHIHIPSGSILKEGPSAGVALTTSIISAFTNFKVRDDIAMTGEITLRGNILPVGGLREKSLGAFISNIKTMFIPVDNVSDLCEIPDDIKGKINYIPVKNYMEIFQKLGGLNVN